MDIYDDSPTNTLLTIVSNQDGSPFRMILHNVGTGISTNFDQATNELTYTKFSPSGKYIFTSCADNKFRMYTYDVDTLTYVFETFYDTTIYGQPYAITSTSDDFVTVAAGRYILLFSIVDD